MSTVKLHELEGLAYEIVFMEEVSQFKDAALGVNANDVAAALIVRDEGGDDLLERLYRREIHVVGEVDEESRFEELEFEN